MKLKLITLSLMLSIFVTGCASSYDSYKSDSNYNRTHNNANKAFKDLDDNSK